MASLAASPAPMLVDDDRFFRRGAIAMVLVIVAGFSTQLAMGRSSFASPPLVHAHALVFMGWTAIFLAQSLSATSGNIAFHRRLGWLAAVWIIPMIILGCMVTLAIVRRGQVPFFFQPLQFLVFDPVSVFTFAGLTVAAVVLRRHTGWHRRLHFCAMAILLGPGFGRLLPMPLLAPWAYEATFAASLLFPIVGIVADLRRSGRVHPAWLWGIGVMVAATVTVEIVSKSRAGDALYAAVTRDYAGANVPPRDFPPPPAGPRRTGRS